MKRSIELPGIPTYLPEVKCFRKQNDSFVNVELPLFTYVNMKRVFLAGSFDRWVV